MRAILSREFAGRSSAYIATVVASFRDDPLALRAPGPISPSAAIRRNPQRARLDSIRRRASHGRALGTANEAAFCPFIPKADIRAAPGETSHLTIRATPAWPKRRRPPPPVWANPPANGPSGERRVLRGEIPSRAASPSSTRQRRFALPLQLLDPAGVEIDARGGAVIVAGNIPSGNMFCISATDRRSWPATSRPALS